MFDAIEEFFVAETGGREALYGFVVDPGRDGSWTKVVAGFNSCSGGVGVEDIVSDVPFEVAWFRVLAAIARLDRGLCAVWARSLMLKLMRRSAL